MRTASRKEHKIHPFDGPAKGLENSEAPHINKDSSPLANAVFHRHFYAAGGTDKVILPATLGQTSRT